METAKISQLYDLGETIAAELFAGLTYPWEALPKISGFIKKLGPTLDPEVYEQRGENIWVAKSATVAPTAFLNGPLIRFSVTNPIWVPARSLPMSSRIRRWWW